MAAVAMLVMLHPTMLSMCTVRCCSWELLCVQWSYDSAERINCNSEQALDSIATTRELHGRATQLVS